MSFLEASHNRRTAARLFLGLLAFSAFLFGEARAPKVVLDGSGSGDLKKGPVLIPLDAPHLEIEINDWVFFDSGGRSDPHAVARDFLQRAGKLYAAGKLLKEAEVAAEVDPSKRSAAGGLRAELRDDLLRFLRESRRLEKLAEEGAGQFWTQMAFRSAISFKQTHTLDPGPGETRSITLSSGYRKSDLETLMKAMLEAADKVMEMNQEDSNTILEAIKADEEEAARDN